MGDNTCQSCGMLMEEGSFGTNADGSVNEEYCIHCYKDGKFVEDFTFEQMVDHLMPFYIECHQGMNISDEKLRSMTKQFLITLKRWSE